MDKKKLSFEVADIDIRPLVTKDFLELQIKAISTANPNRNGSWFTKESLEKSLNTFRNKPILGYFENGDFVSHNGEWVKDPETKIDYWDTLGKKGERILGLVRSEDELKIIEDKDGLSWACVSCALWTQYSFKQVKRLIKDAKRAMQNGESAKNVSVEVDITDYEILDNGVMKINEFNLIGITILGSRNGVKVEPGIENAELSVVDIMGKELYEKQTQSIRLAYEKLSNPEDISNQEVSSEMDGEIINETVNNVDVNLATETNENEASVDVAESDVAKDDDTLKNNFEDCNNDHDEDDHDEDDHDEEETCPKCGKNPCECEECGGKHENEECSCEGECECEEPERDPVRDVAWLINECCWNIENYTNSIKYYETHEIKGKEYILSVLRRFLAQAQDSEKELAELLAKITSDYAFTDEEISYQEELSAHCDCKELYKNNCELQGKCNLLEANISSYEHKEFISNAKEKIYSANLSEDIIEKLFSCCESGEISSLDVLEQRINSEIKTFEESVFNADVYTPIITIDQNQGKEKADRWTRMRKNVGKE